MDIRSLIQFLQIAKDGSYTKAAENLFLVQSTLSKTVQSLETELGVKLLRKNGKQVSLTDFGERLVELATPIVNQFNQIPQLIMEDVSKDVGIVNIATTPLLGGLYLGKIIARFGAAYPNIQLHITEGSTISVRDSVLNSTCDVGFCILNVLTSDSNLTNIPLFKKEIAVALNRESPLAAKQKIRMQDLRDEKFNLYSSGHAINTEILNRCREEGFQPAVNYSSSNMVFLLQLTASGNGISLLPAPCATEEEWPDLRIRSLDPPLPWECGMIMRRGAYHSHAVNLFTRFAQEEIKPLL